MLQINVQPYASDALEDAMRLAQTKALNSYSFSDMLNYLNYTWMDMYQQLAFVDEGFYSKTMRLTSKLTKLPPCVKNSIKVYAAQTQNTTNREVFRQSGTNDLNARSTFHISGFDIFCPDAERRAVWLNYLPQQPQIFFTRDNRDPKLYLDPNKMPQKVGGAVTQHYNLWDIIWVPVAQGDYVYYGPTSVKMNIFFRYRNASQGIQDVNMTGVFTRAYGTTSTEADWIIWSFICDYPYIFVTFKHRITGEYLSGFYHHMPEEQEFIEYNPFAFTGRNSNVEYLQAKWNDKTGLGVIINDWNDLDEFGIPRVKELGWTPDTLLTYPTPEMYRYLVARLADKMSALNESNIMGVQKELAESEVAFKSFTGKSKSAWKRIDNVNGPTIADWL